LTCCDELAGYFSKFLIVESLVFWLFDETIQVFSHFIWKHFYFWYWSYLFGKKFHQKP